MIRLLTGSLIAAFLTITCNQRPSIAIHTPPCEQVYSILLHNDSLYFSTHKNGIFRMHPHDSLSMKRIAGYRNAPFRSFVFTNQGTIMAGSYEQGLFIISNDSMVPVPGLPRVIWRIRRDSTTGCFWFATGRGVFVSNSKGYQQFITLPDAHDIAFCNNQVAVAHLNGITIFNKENGILLHQLCKGISCWTVERFDSLFVGGGRDFLFRIDPETGNTSTINLKGNFLWAVTRDANGNLILGTQKGMFLVSQGSKHARQAGLKGTCCKSVVIDNKNRIWAGRF